MPKTSDPVNKNLLHALEFIYHNPNAIDFDVKLSSLSKRDKVWDKHRAQTQDVASIYENSEFSKYAERLADCSTYLDFAIDEQKGLNLKRSFFCKVRNCPVCQWRKSLYWKAMMYRAYDKIKNDYAGHRWIFLTLTVENPKIEDLRASLQVMNKAFYRLVRRKEFKYVLGFIRTTEVTRDKKRPYTHAHPHFHCMLLVDKAYFEKKNYVHHDDWVVAWAECLGVSYLPNVDVRAVYSKSDEKDLRDVVSETLKYACKPSDMIFDRSKESNYWFLEYTRQVNKLRFVNTGGILKNALKDENDITNKDMIVINESEQDSDKTDDRILSFSYYPKKRCYIFKPNEWYCYSRYSMIASIKLSIMA